MGCFIILTFAAAISFALWTSTALAYMSWD